MRNTRLLTIILACSIVLNSCTSITVSLPEIRSIEQYSLRQEKDGIIVALDRYIEKERVEKVFNKDLLEDDLLPILVIVSNRSDGAILFSSEKTIITSSSISSVGSHSLDNYTTEKFGGSNILGTGPLTTEQQIGQHAAVAGATIAPGIAMMAFGTVILVRGVAIAAGWNPVRDQIVAMHMSEVALIDKTIAQGQTAHGFIYLYGWRKLHHQQDIILTITITRPASGLESKFVFPFNGLIENIRQ